MKRILITGANSYIGTSVENWLAKFDGQYKIDTLDMLDPNWHEHDFSNYDTLFHVAAIVHKNEKNVNPKLYDQVNRDLPLKLAEKAKNEGVGQFIFLSSMSVYGDNEEIIDSETVENPQTLYGKSKLEAEKLLQQLADSNFKLVILRPPMVYGPNATGNYTRLSKLSNYTPVFPKIDNKRSMIFIDNLSEFIRCAVEYQISGLYFPQNKEYVNTSSLVSTIRKVHGKRTVNVRIFNFIIQKMMFVSPIKKLFSNLTYDIELSKYDFDYQVTDFTESIMKSEID